MSEDPGSNQPSTMESTKATPEDIHAFTERYIQDCWPKGHPFDLSKEDQDRMAYVLGAALDAIREESKLESRWSPAQLFGNKENLAHFVDTKMEKTGARCAMTIYAGRVSMEFTLPHLNELPSMNSTFWSCLGGIIDRQKLHYVNHEIPEAVSKSEANKSISKFVKAPLFAFLTQFHIVYQHDPEGDIRLGGFEKSIFFPESTWAEIIAIFTEVFREFSRLSQSLYRSYYLKASKDPKRRLGLSDLETVRRIFSWISARSDAWTPTDVGAAFPGATKIDIQTAHDLALERDMISGVGKPFRSFVRTDSKGSQQRR